MIKLINSHTGTDMWVAENRLDEYLAAGHKLAAEAPAEEPAKAVKKKVKN